MEHKIFSIYDQKAHAYLPPFTLPNSDMALRTFADCVNADGHAFNRHPSDYTLCELGVYDDSDAKIIPLDIYISLGVGIEFYKHPSPTEDQNNGDQQPERNDAPILPGPISGNSS